MSTEFRNVSVSRFTVWLVVAIAVVLAGCPAASSGGGGGGGDDDDPTDAELAEELVNEGLDFITDSSNRDWDAAFSSFAQAYDADPTNPSAALWYAMLNLADIATDDDTQEFLSDFIGLGSYPEALNELLDPSQTDSWLSQTIVPDADSPSDTMSVPFVSIPDSIKTWDSEDGGTAAIITSKEYLLGLANAAVSNNLTGFTDARNALVDLLQTRLTEVINVLDAVPASAGVSITYEMYFASQAEALDAGWPATSGGGAADLQIGAAEAKVLASTLYGLQSILYRTRVIDVTFPVQTFWNVLNPVSTHADAGDFSALPNPINSGFLSPTSGAAAYLADGKTAAQPALSLAREALNAILSDRSGFALSSSSPISELASNWTNVESALNFQFIAATRLLDSIQNGTDVFVPVDFEDYADLDAFFAAYDTTGEWPTSAAFASDGIPLVAPVDLQAMFATPLLAIDSIVELESDGDPSLYEFTAIFDTATGEPTSLTAAHGGSATASLSSPEGGGAANNSLYAIRLPDITLGGAIPVASAIGDLRNALEESGPFPKLTDASDIVELNGDDTVSVYLPLLPPHVAYGAFASAGEAVTMTATEYTYWMEDDGGQTYTTQGSLFSTLAADRTQIELWDSLKGVNSGTLDVSNSLVAVASETLQSTGGNSPFVEYRYMVEPQGATLDSVVVTLDNISFSGSAADGGIYVYIYVVPNGSLDGWEEGSYDVDNISFSSSNDPAGFSTDTSANPFSVDSGAYLIIEIENSLEDGSGDPIDATIDITVTETTPAI